MLIDIANTARFSHIQKANIPADLNMLDAEQGNDSSTPCQMGVICSAKRRMSAKRRSAQMAFRHSARCITFSRLRLLR